MLTQQHFTGIDRAVSRCGCATALWVAAVPMALAQGPGDQNELDEVYVTAQRREQPLLETPVSISVITEQEMERQNIDSFADYAVRVPGLTFEQVGIIGYRGAEDVTLRAVQGRTNYYLDETPLPVTDVRLFDVERIEVLRGPQGTLYGDSSMGGTIKVVTNKPTTAGFSGAAATNYSLTEDGGDSFSAETYVNVPLSDRVALRVTGYYEELGGYVDNIPPTVGLGDQSGGVLPFRVNVRKDVDSGNRKGARVALRFQPSESVNVDLSAWLQDIDLGARAFYDEPTPLETSFRGTMFESQSLEIYNGTLEWTGEKLGLLSSTTYYTDDTINSEDITVFLAQGLFGFSPSVFTNPQQLNNSFPAEGFTHETRLSFDGEIGSKPVFVVGGVFYSDTKTSRDQYWYDLQSITDISLALDPSGGFDFGVLFDALGVERGLWGFQLLPNEVKQLAFFGEFSIKPVPRLELTAGLRYFEFDIKETRTTDGFLFQGFETSSGKTSDSDVIVRFNAKADVSDDVMIYANAAQGFNIGSALGSALPDICQPALDALGLSDGPVDPETLWSYELGTKGRFRGGKVVIDTSVYYIDWKDIQEFVNFPDNTCPEGFLGNFGDATIKGGELAFSFLPTERLQIGGSIGYSDVSRSQDAIGTTAAEQIGNTLLTTAIQVQYTFPISTQMTGYIGADHQYIEEGEEDAPGTPHYNLTNLRIGLIGKDTWEAAIVGRNIFDSDPVLATFAPGSIGNLLPQDATLRPRTIGIEARKRF